MFPTAVGIRFKFKPEGVTEATPVLVYVHGGGWSIGDYQGDDAPKDAKKQNCRTTNDG